MSNTPPENHSEAPREQPFWQELTDHVNFLVKIAFAFRGENDIGEKLKLFTSHDRRISYPAKRIIADAIKPLLLGTHKRGDCVFSSERMETLHQMVVGNDESLQALDQITNGIEDLVQAYSHSPKPGNANAVNRLFTLIEGHYPIELFGHFRTPILRHFRTLQQRGTLFIEDYQLSPEQLEQLIGAGLKGRLCQQSVPLGSHVKAPDTPWMADFVRFGTESETARPKGESMVHLEPFRNLLAERAPQGLEAIDQLVTIRGFKQANSQLRKILSDLLADLIPHFSAQDIDSLREPNDFFQCLLRKRQEDDLLKVFAAELELNYRKSSSHNPMLWAEIELAAQFPNDPSFLSKIVEAQNIQPMVRAEAIVTLKNRTESDVRNIIISTLGLEPQDLPRKIVGLEPEEPQDLPKEIAEPQGPPRDIAAFDMEPQESPMQIAIQEMEPRDPPNKLVTFLLKGAPDELNILKVQTLLLSDPGIVQKSIENFLARKKLPSHIIAKLIPMVVRNVSEQIAKGRNRIAEVLNFDETVALSLRLQNSSENSLESMMDHGEFARQAMLSRYPTLFEHQAPHRISETDFRERFHNAEGPSAQDPSGPVLHFHSLNFDGAQLGLTDRRILKRANSLAHPNPKEGLSSMAFKESFPFLRRNILRSVVSDTPDSPYSVENIRFTDGGTNAFNLYLLPHIQPGDQVLVTSEEYRHFIHVIQQKGAEPVTLPDYREFSNQDPSIFKNKLIEIFKSHPKIRFMLISELTRHGTLFPLEILAKFRDAARSQDKPLYLAVDGCQSFGRRVTDLNRLKPDVYLASAYKGIDAGKAGFAIFSEHFQKEMKILPDNKTDDPETLARILLGANPLALNRGDILSIPERQRAIQDLSCKFVRLVDAINQDCSRERIRLLTPAHSYRDAAGNPIPEQMSGVFECQIDDLTRSQVSDFAKRFGVHIAPSFPNPLSADKSFRIAFHPHMGNDSLLVLGYVLANAA